MSDNYIPAYIEKCPAYGWQGSPNFKTLIETMENGRENRNAQWSQPRHSYNVPYRNIKKEAYASIKQMHLLCMGRVKAFLFLDQLDYQATNEVFAEGDGATTEFQLRKVSTLEGVSYARNVYAIRSAAVTVNGTPATPTVDMERGTVTFVAAPADGAVLRWTGEFAIWVRFDQDDLPFSIDNGNRSGERFINGTVALIEVPPPPEPTT